jgi:hypothetical protein
MLVENQMFSVVKQGAEWKNWKKIERVLNSLKCLDTNTTCSKLNFCRIPFQ